jgi:hypothetical protein
MGFLLSYSAAQMASVESPVARRTHWAKEINMAARHGRIRHRLGVADGEPETRNRMIINAADEPRHRAAAVAGARHANRAEEPIAWLHARGHISDRQFAAGIHLRRDFEIAGLGPRVTMAWDAGPVTRGRRSAPDAADPGTAGISAKARLDGALAAAGSGIADVLTRTVCLGEGLETAERAMGWPARAGKVVLGLGLDRVADFYRL